MYLWERSHIITPRPPHSIGRRCPQGSYPAGVHSTKAMARRAVALIVALLHERADVDAVARLLLEYGERPPLDLTSHDVETMREAAARLAGVFGADTVDEAAALLNELLADSAGPPRLTSHNGTSNWHLHVDAADEGPWGPWFLASSGMALAVLLADHQRVPGGLCAATGCGKPYLDLGGGSPRRYCGTRCATRERVAAHRAAHP